MKLKSGGCGLDDGRKKRRRRIEIIRFMAGYRIPKRRRLLHVKISQHHAGTVQQWQELLFDRSVKSDRCDAKHTISRPHRKIRHLRGP
jgi:hypothetical protein